MKRLIWFAVFTIPLLGLSQDERPSAPNISDRKGRTLLKYNVPGAFFNSHTIQLERVVGLKHSLAVSFNFGGQSSLPFKDILLDQFGSDQQAADIIESVKFDRFSITPEFRFYLGAKGAPSGFYLAPFLRYSRMNSEQKYSFTDSDNSRHNVDFKGTLTGFGGGLMMGSQWTLGRNVVLDLWLAGPFYGKMRGDFTGVDSQPIKDPIGLENDIESVDLGPWQFDATVSGQRVDVKLDGPYVGLRAGLCIGIRF